MPNNQPPLVSENDRIESSKNSVFSGENEYENYRISFKKSTIREKFLLISGGVMNSSVGIVFPHTLEGLKNVKLNGVVFTEKSYTEGHYTVTNATMEELSQMLDVPDWFSKVASDPFDFFTLILPVDTFSGTMRLDFEYSEGKFSEEFEYVATPLLFDSSEITSILGMPDVYNGPFVAVPRADQIEIVVLGVGVVTSVLVNGSEVEFIFENEGMGQLFRQIRLSNSIVNDGDLVTINYSANGNELKYEHPLNIYVS